MFFIPYRSKRPSIKIRDTEDAQPKDLAPISSQHVGGYQASGFTANPLSTIPEAGPLISSRRVKESQAVLQPVASSDGLSSILHVLTKPYMDGGRANTGNSATPVDSSTDVDSSISMDSDSASTMASTASSADEPPSPRSPIEVKTKGLASAPASDSNAGAVDSEILSQPKQQHEHGDTLVPFPFLQLPPELRLKVYDNLLRLPENDDPWTAAKKSLQILPSRAEATARVHPAILRTCRLVHGEAEPVLYSGNVFDASPSGWQPGCLADSVSLRPWYPRMSNRPRAVRKPLYGTVPSDGSRAPGVPTRAAYLKRLGAVNVSADMSAPLSTVQPLLSAQSIRKLAYRRVRRFRLQVRLDSDSLPFHPREAERAFSGCDFLAIHPWTDQSSYHVRSPRGSVTVESFAADDGSPPTNLRILERVRAVKKATVVTTRGNVTTVAWEPYGRWLESVMMLPPGLMPAPYVAAESSPTPVEPAMPNTGDREATDPS